MSSLALSWVQMYGHHAVGARAYRRCSAQLSHTHGDNAAEVVNMFTNEGPRCRRAGGMRWSAARELGMCLGGALGYRLCRR